jgi:Cullin binding
MGGSVSPCACVQLDDAIRLWQQLFVGTQAWPYTEQWCEFLREKHGRPMMNDTWCLLLQFKKVRLQCVGLRRVADMSHRCVDHLSLALWLLVR